MQTKKPRLTNESRFTGQESKVDLGKYWFSSMSISEIPGMPGFQNAFQTGLYDFKSYIDEHNIQLTGSRKVGVATTANPMYLSKNFLYSYSYAYTSQNRSPESTYIGVFEVMDTKELFDLTKPADFIELFGDKYTNNPVFFELFQKAEIYFSWNSNITAFDKIGLQPMEYQLARIVLLWRMLNAGVKLTNSKGTPLTVESIFKIFDDKLEDVKPQTGLFAAVKKRYKTLDKRYKFLDLMFIENIPEKCFDDLTKAEYQKIQKIYDKQVFELSYKLDPDNKYGDGYMHDKQNPNVILKHRYAEKFPNDTRANVNKNWPVSRDDSIGLNQEKNSVISQKITAKEFPSEIGDQSLRYVNSYLKLTYEVRKVIQDAANDEKMNLDEYYKFIDRAWKSKNLDKVGYIETSFVDPLQHFLCQMIVKNNKKWHGIYCPEVAGQKPRFANKNFQKWLKNPDTLKDETIFLWNSENLKLVDVIPMDMLEKRTAV